MKCSYGHYHPHAFNNFALKFNNLGGNIAVVLRTGSQDLGRGLSVLVKARESNNHFSVYCRCCLENKRLRMSYWMFQFNSESAVWAGKQRNLLSLSCTNDSQLVVLGAESNRRWSIRAKEGNNATII